MAEINNYELRIDAVSRTVQHRGEDGHFASYDIKNRQRTLHDHWNQLKVSMRKGDVLTLLNSTIKIDGKLRLTIDKTSSRLICWIKGSSD